MNTPLETESAIAPGAFPPENGGISDSERRAENAALPLPTETDDTPAFFPLESVGVVGTDNNASRSLPLENSGVNGG